jgi:hypothetical protein
MHLGGAPDSERWVRLSNLRILSITILINYMKKLSAILLAVSLGLTGMMALTPGCAAMAYQTRKQDRESKDRQAYANYTVEMERLNFERELAGLPPRRILTFEEWTAAPVPP